MNEYLPYLTSSLFTIVSVSVGYLTFVRNKNKDSKAREDTQDKDRIDLKDRVTILESYESKDISRRVAEIEGKMVGWEEHTRTLACISSMQKDLATLTEQSKVYWEVIGPKLRDIIHSPTHKTRDALVDLLLEDRITTLAQAQKLESELEKLWADTGNPAEQVASAIFLARTKWLLQQLQKEIKTDENTCLQ